MREIKAPNEFREDNTEKSTLKIFLAGSIEMGKAKNWQEKVKEQIADMEIYGEWSQKKEIKILNPRRDDWDSSWEQSIHNSQFREQVEWELRAMEAADIILLWFEPDTKSPISLLELGLFANSEKMAVYCPEGFWRKGNVDVVCEKYGIPHFETEKDFIDFMNEFIELKV